MEKKKDSSRRVKAVGTGTDPVPMGKKGSKGRGKMGDKSNVKMPLAKTSGTGSDDTP